MFVVALVFGLMALFFFVTGGVCLKVAVKNFRLGISRRANWQTDAATALFAIGISTASMTIIFWKIGE